MSVTLRPALTRRSFAYAITAVAMGLISVFATGVAAQADASRPSNPKPTIVLVHGAWADASSWNRVTARLQGEGYTVLAPANPLRGTTADAGGEH